MHSSSNTFHNALSFTLQPPDADGVHPLSSATAVLFTFSSEISYCMSNLYAAEQSTPVSSLDFLLLYGLFSDWGSGSGTCEMSAAGFSASSDSSLQGDVVVSTLLESGDLSAQVFAQFWVVDFRGSGMLNFRGGDASDGRE